MRNQREATARRLSDPDFQARLVNTSMLLCLAMSVVVVALVAHEAWLWTHPPSPRYFAIDGKHTPRPVVALDSPIVDDAELLEWTVKAILAPYNVNYHDYPVQLNTASRRFTPGLEHVRAVLHQQRQFRGNQARPVALPRADAARRAHQSDIVRSRRPRLPGRSTDHADLRKLQSGHVLVADDFCARRSHRQRRPP